MSLQKFFDDIVTNAAIDYGSDEIQDICCAVGELVRRYAENFKEQGLPFKILRIQPCGSMVEKTGMWKTKMTRVEDKGPFKTDEYTPYLEFDYLAVFEKSRDMTITAGRCSGCKTVNGSLGVNFYNDLKRSGKIDLEEYDKKFDKEVLRNSPGAINKMFKDSLRTSIVSLCGCFHLEKYKPELFISNTYSVVNTSTDGLPNKCDNCTIYKKSGYLQLESMGYPVNCSFMLNWTSKTKNLFAPRFSSLIKSKQIDKISIHVDLLPAIELVKTIPGALTLEHDYFIVAKRCSLNRYNIRNWRTSYCLNEIDMSLTKTSIGHRNCQMVIKYLFEQLNLRFDVSPWLNGYHGKTAILSHSRTCLRKDGKYKTCVIAIIKDLFNAYYNSNLKPHFGTGNLLGTYTTTEDKTEVMKCLLKIFQIITSKIKLRWRYKPWQQKLYSSERCIRIMTKMAAEMKI